MAEKIASKYKEDNLVLGDMAMDIELEGHVLANKEKVKDHHFLGLMVELLKWEKNAPEVETSKGR